VQARLGINPSGTARCNSVWYCGQFVLAERKRTMR
jgi:hypothetical protein